MRKIEKMIKQDKRFVIKLQDYIQTISNYKYIFEITKTCGYSELFIVYKDNTLVDLYKNICLQFCCDKVTRLYVKNNITSEEINIPNTSDMIRSFILENTNCLRPIYDDPTPIVYRVYLDY